MERLLRGGGAAVLALLLSAPVAAQPLDLKPAPRPANEEFVPQSGQAGKDVIWVPTPDEVVEKMLELTQVAPGERVIDLGSGDGKIAIAAAKRGARAKGIEYNPDMVTLSRRNAEKAGVKVEFVQGDIFVADFTDADVVTLYLLPSLNEKLRPTLLKMKPGTRVTSHSFLMGDWAPDETVTVNGRDAHFWRVPADITGDWNTRLGNNSGPRLRVTQKYQKIEGSVQWGDRVSPLLDPVVKGAFVAFRFADPKGALHRFEGVADHGGPLIGIVIPDQGGAQRLLTATRR